MKKILIVNSQSLKNNNATGITLRSIFGVYDKTCLLEICWNKPLDNNVDFKINTCYLNYSRFSIAYFIRKWKNNKINNYIKNGNNVENKTFICKCLTYIRQYISLLLDDTKLSFKDDQEKIVDSFHPDIIYTIGECINALKLSYKFSQKYNIPIIIHYFDNWLYSIQWENNPLLALYKRKLRSYAKKCQQRCNVGITISDEMAKEYTEKLGIVHYTLMNSINCKEFNCKEYNNSKKIFLYAGGLHLGREKILKLFANNLYEFKKLNTIDIELHIYTFESDINMFKEYFNNNNIVKLYRAVPHEKIKEIYESSYALVHVEQFDNNINDFFKFSISTKIPEYLSTYRPIIFLGPSNIYLFNLLKEKNIAYTASTNEELRTVLNSLMFNTEYNRRMTKNAFLYSMENFDINVTHKKLLSIISKSKIL